jgi:PAS domain S-box-containing protein
MMVSLLIHVLSAALGAVLVWMLAKRSSARTSARPVTESDHEQRYREALERLELVSEFAGVGIWDWNLRTDRLATDTHVASVFAQPDQGAIGDPKAFVRRIIHPEDLAAFQDAIRQAIRQKQPLEHHYRTLHPDGSIHHRQLNARVYCDADGTPIRFLGVSVETTRLKEAAVKVDRQSGELIERFNLAANAAGIALWEWKTGERIVHTDARMADAALYGQLADEVDPVQFMNETLHPEDREDFLRTIQRAFESADHLSQRYRIRKPDGGIAHLQFHARIFRDARNVPTRLLGVTLDVTEQALAAEKLEQQTQHERDLLRRLNLATRRRASRCGTGIWPPIASPRIRSSRGRSAARCSTFARGRASSCCRPYTPTTGFLTKPIEIARLHETLDRYGLGARVPEKLPDEAATGPSETLPIALTRLNEITEGDSEFAYELASTFIASGEQVMSEVRSALGAFDRPALARAAHKLKGASANINADPLRELAHSLESQAANLDQPRLKDLISELTEEFGRAAEFLRVHAPAPAAKTG